MKSPTFPERASMQQFTFVHPEAPASIRRLRHGPVVLGTVAIVLVGTLLMLLARQGGSDGTAGSHNTNAVLVVVLLVFSMFVSFISFASHRAARVLFGVGEECIRINGTHVVWDPRGSFWRFFDEARWLVPGATPETTRNTRLFYVSWDWRPGLRFMEGVLTGAYPKEEFRIGETSGAHLVEALFPTHWRAGSETVSLHYIRFKLREEWRSMGIGGSPEELQELMEELGGGADGPPPLPSAGVDEPLGQ